MRSVKYVLVGFVSLFLSACNINKISTAYCPASIHAVQTNKTLLVGKVYDDRFNKGNLTNDPNEIGEFSWEESIAPYIYYDNQPIAGSMQTAIHISLSQAGYKLTYVHPDRILYTRINKIDLMMEGRDNRTHEIVCRIRTKVAVTDAHDKVIWRKYITGEGSAVVNHDEVRARHWKHSVKKAYNAALDDFLLQLERSKEFNKTLR